MERSHLPAAAFRWLARFLGLSLITLSLFASSLPTRSTAQPGEAFLRPGQLVVASDRPVCSLLGSLKRAAGIVGMDGGFTVSIGGVVYWDFGDTVLSNGWIMPNSIAWSTDTDASDCIELTPKQLNGSAAPLMVQPFSEKLTVWPMSMEQTGPTTVHFFYASVVPDPAAGWRVKGVGIGSFDTTTLTATPALGGKLLWQDGTFQPSRTLADGEYTYVLLDAYRSPWKTATILARVRTQSIEDPSAYEYWDAGAPGETGRWVAGLWNAATGSWDSAVNDLAPLWEQPGLHNGVDIAYNQFLGKWLAVYTTNFMTSVHARAADSLTGPWGEYDTMLVNCANFHPAPSAAQMGFMCYSGTQHEPFTRDGGRTIYVSYSHSKSYQVYLHEIRLAAPMTQWNDGQGHIVYQPGAQGPPGFSADGISFYASDIPAPGLTPIHRWQNTATGAFEYGAATPGPDYVDRGIDFYAPLDAVASSALNASYAPVYRWTRGTDVRYSPLNLAPAGFTQQAASFYAACPDTDADTLTDCAETFYGTNPLAADTDGDGLPDAYEITARGCNPLVYNADDRDGLSLLQEVQAGTSACVWDSGAWGCAHAEWHNPACDVDTDGDGCSDAAELGPDPRLGGRRDATNRWDFYDVNRDRVVTLLGDVLPVIRAFGSLRNYSLAVDRSPPPPASVQPDASRREAWDLGPPDGAITVASDILGAARQFGHTCRSVP